MGLSQSLRLQWCRVIDDDDDDEKGLPSHHPPTPSPLPMYMSLFVPRQSLFLVETMSLEALMDQGEKALGQFNPELALKFFSRALEQSPNDTSILDLLGETSIHAGLPGEALAYFLRSSVLKPDENAYKWLYLGQLQEAETSLKCFRKGIAMLSATLAATDDKGITATAEATKVRKEIAKAYCSIADIYMTDLCMEVDAEKECEAAVKAASEHDSESLDLGLCLASLRLSQCRAEDACDVIEGVYKRILSVIDTAAKRPIIAAFKQDPPAGSAAADDDTHSPSAEYEHSKGDENVEPEVCISVVKRLIECSAVRPALAIAACEMLERLLLTDDSNVELWYLMGAAAMYCEPVEAELAVEHLMRAKEMLEAMAEQQTGRKTKMPEELVDQYTMVCESLVCAKEGLDAADEGTAMDQGDDDVEELPEDEEWT